MAWVTVTAHSANADRALEGWTRSFFERYSEFDGSHLSFYADDAVLTDVFLGLELASKVEITDTYRVAAERYENVHFQVAAVAVESLVDAQDNPPAQPIQGTAVVRGQVTGSVAGIEFDLPFVTWLELRQGRIKRQWDYVDYTTLAARLAETQAAEMPPEDH